ncbi:Protein ZNF783 [Tupaia chinensis]|uniref:Protein ZNF783 n=1 Tax=Tupaia chinensis TaxID=246437 RepID=L9LDQ5_TUPCH|nr:Protein ZNF783 [Tupaia chinensis]
MSNWLGSSRHLEWCRTNPGGSFRSGRPVWGLRQRRLENVETLLRDGNFWILRLPPGSKGEAPQVPVMTEDMVACVPQQRAGRLEDWQEGLCEKGPQGPQETLGRMDRATTTPEPLTPVERGDEAAGRSLPSTQGGTSAGTGLGLAPRSCPDTSATSLRPSATRHGVTLPCLLDVHADGLLPPF